MAHNMTKPDAYVASLRNAAKRSYAERYLAWLRASSGHVTADEPDRRGLSVMAAQAVRLQLHQLYREETA